MMEKTMKNKSKSTRYLSVAWSPFAQKLAGVLGKLQEDQYLIVSVKDSNRYVQFAGQGSFGLRVETTSNCYLFKPEQLNKRQIATLIDSGWNGPTGNPDDSTPENDPDGSPNFFVDFPAPVSFQSVADLTVRTFAEILRVPYPASLQYQAFEKGGEVIALPELGLKLASPLPAATGQEDLPHLLLAALKEMTGLTNLEFDGDGDIGFSYGSALVYVRLIGEPPFVRVYSRILSDVQDGDGVLTRLNDINASEPMVHFVFRKDAIFALADICASPFVGAHVVQALPHFCAIVDGMDSLLQMEFGGQTALVEPMPSSMRH